MKDIDTILEQINLDEKEVFTPNYICEEKKDKLNWVGMDRRTFMRRVDRGEIKSIKLKLGSTEKIKFCISRENLLDYLQKQNYENN